MTVNIATWKVHCPQCQSHQFFEFKNFSWQQSVKGELVGMPYFECTDCSFEIDEKLKDDLLMHGHWVIDNIKKRVTGYRMSNFYFISWKRIIDQFLECKKDPSRLRAFVNDVLGEPWKERAWKPDVDPHKNKRLC